MYRFYNIFDVLGLAALPCENIKGKIIKDNVYNKLEIFEKKIS